MLYADLIIILVLSIIGIGGCIVICNVVIIQAIKDLTKTLKYILQELEEFKRLK